jgi:hypothetical protein
MAAQLAASQEGLSSVSKYVRDNLTNGSGGTAGSCKVRFSLILRKASC